MEQAGNIFSTDVHKIKLFIFTQEVWCISGRREEACTCNSLHCICMYLRKRTRGEKRREGPGEVRMGRRRVSIILMHTSTHTWYNLESSSCD